MDNAINQLREKLSSLEVMSKSDSSQWDWQMLKQIICAIAAVLGAIADMLPANLLLVKEILKAISTALQFVCSQLPGSEKK